MTYTVASEEFFTVHTARVCHTGLVTACEVSANLYDIYHRKLSANLYDRYHCKLSADLYDIYHHKLSANLYDIYHCCVFSEKTPDDGQSNCLKHVGFYSKNKFEKLVHLVGIIIRISHDARSPERQIPMLVLSQPENKF